MKTLNSGSRRNNPFGAIDPEVSVMQGRIKIQQMRVTDIHPAECSRYKGQLSS
jgi:hypothetical protein